MITTESKGCRVGREAHPDAVLCRGNADALQEVNGRRAAASRAVTRRRVGERRLEAAARSIYVVQITASRES